MKPQQTVLLDPTSELTPARRQRVAPPEGLDGKVVALQSIGKARSAEFLDYLEARFQARGVATLRTAKPSNARRANVDLLHAIATRADVVVQALAD
jgi:hypothetical protein